MRGYFDSEEPEGEELEERGNDTEVTLTTSAQLGIVFGLLFLCGLCFGLGYWVGHRSSPAAPEKAATQPAGPTAAPDQEPLQGNGTIPKPSADAQAPAPAVSPASDGETAPSADGGVNPSAPKQGPAAAGQTGPPASSPASAPAPAAPPQTPSPVKAAFPASGNGSPGASPAAPTVRPAMPGAAGQFMVQVAAVSHQEDADVLVNALRKRGYAVTAQRVQSDGLIHVRIGPFATHDEANRMCARLLNDGYNALVQP